MKNKLLIILCTFISAITFAQDDYLIFNVMVNDNYSHTGTNTNSYWIMKISGSENISLNNDLSPLYLSEDLSQDAINDCFADKKIDLFTTTENTKRNFQPNFINELNNLESLLNKRVLLQKITKSWKNNKRKVKVEVYVTPIKGIFTVCMAETSMKKRFDIPERIFIPTSDFTLLNFDILEREDIKPFLFNADFSKFTFANRVW